MATLGFTGVERGRNVSLEFDGDQIIKTSHTSMTRGNAMFTGGLLWKYSGGLGQLLNMAEVQSVSLVPSEKGSELCHVRHVMNLVSGPNICRVPPDEFRVALSSIIGALCSMPRDESRGPATLVHPVDAAPKNWHLDGDTPTLVDVYPPLARDEDGNISLYRALSLHEQREIEEAVGQLGRIVPDLLLTAVPPLPQNAMVDWCIDTLPQGIEPPLLRLLEGEIRYNVGISCFD